MEITLEKIELVKDRTGVTYKEAKDALEAADGNVVDAIIAIEEQIDDMSTGRIGAKKEELKDKVKEILNKGNVSRIIVSKDGENILNIPLNAGIVGALVAPWGVVAAAVAALGFKCQIEFIKDDGSVIDLSEKAGVFYEEAKEKGTDIYADIKEKAPGIYEDLKEKGGEALAKAKEKMSREANDDYDDFAEFDNEEENDIRMEHEKEYTVDEIMKEAVEEDEKEN